MGKLLIVYNLCIYQPESYILILWDGLNWRVLDTEAGDGMLPKDDRSRSRVLVGAVFSLQLGLSSGWSLVQVIMALICIVRRHLRLLRTHRTTPSHISPASTTSVGSSFISSPCKSCQLLMESYVIFLLHISLHRCIFTSLLVQTLRNYPEC